MGGNWGGSSGSGRSLNSKERSALFDSSLYNIARGTGSISSETTLDQWRDGGRKSLEFAKYESPEYVNPGEARTLNGGDYDRLEQSLYDRQSTALDNLWGRRRQEIDQSMSDRGLWASGMGDKTASKIYGEEFAPQYRIAASDAAAQRYGLQQNEQNALNQYALSSAQMQNAAKMDAATKEYESGWRPFDYALQLWGSTAGQKSKQSSSSQGFSI